MPVIKGENNILAFSRHIAIGCSQVFTKKIKENMLPFTKGMMAHDWIPVYLADRVGYGVEYIEKPLFGYRLHTDNVFGGRSLKQNLGNWKQNHGKSFKSYKEYRKDAITRAYLSGVLMCKEYNEKLGIDTTKLQNNVIKYYEKCLKTKVISFRIDKYMKYLSFKGIGKRRLKEIMLFHFPIISYLVFLVK